MWKILCISFTSFTLWMRTNHVGGVMSNESCDMWTSECWCHVWKSHAWLHSRMFVYSHSQLDMTPSHSQCKRYDSFHWNRYTPKIHQCQQLRFLSISRYEFKLRFWCQLNLYRGIKFLNLVDLGGNIFSGNCHIQTCVNEVTCPFTDVCIDLTLRYKHFYVKVYSHSQLDMTFWHSPCKRYTNFCKWIHPWMRRSHVQWVVSHVNEWMRRSHVGGVICNESYVRVISNESYIWFIWTLHVAYPTWLNPKP